MSNLIKRLYGKDFSDHAASACLGLVIGLLALAFAGNEIWNWGWWSWLFCIPIVLFFLLLFGLGWENKTRKLLASLSIVYGYVKKVEKWKSAVGDSGEVDEQSIVVGESAHSDQGDSIKLRSRSTQTFNVTEGNVVIVAFGSDYSYNRIISLRKVQEQEERSQGY